MVPHAGLIAAKLQPFMPSGVHIRGRFVGQDMLFQLAHGWRQTTDIVSDNYIAASGMLAAMERLLKRAKAFAREGFDPMRFGRPYQHRPLEARWRKYGASLHVRRGA